MSIRSFATITAAFNAKNPPAAEPGTFDLAAAAAPESAVVDTIEAAAAVRGFASVSGKLQWIRATKDFFVSGEVVPVGGYVQLPELDAKRLIYRQKAVEATEAEVQAAAAGDAKAKK